MSAAGPTSFLPRRLLRGHVARRAERPSPVCVWRRSRPVELLGQAEIGDLRNGKLGMGNGEGRQGIGLGWHWPVTLSSFALPRSAFPFEEDVGRLQVAVDDAALVGEMDGPGQRLHQLAAAGPAAAPPSAVGPGCRPRRIPARNRAGRRARRLRRSARCSGAAAARPPRPRCGSGPARCGAGVSAGQDHLQGDQALQLDVPGLVDHAHAAAAQLPQDLVTRHSSPHGRGHRNFRVDRHRGVFGGRRYILGRKRGTGVVLRANSPGRRGAGASKGRAANTGQVSSNSASVLGTHGWPCRQIRGADMRLVPSGLRRTLAIIAPGRREAREQ